MTKPSDFKATADLLVQYDVHQGHVDQAELDKMSAGLDGLSRQVANFPQHDLRVVIEHRPRTNEFALKLTLLLPGKTLVASDHDVILHAAFERALRSLAHELDAYKDSLERMEERQKQQEGTRQDVFPDLPLDAAALDAAVGAGDYAAFRAVISAYEDALRLRAGRWVERYPEVQAKMGHGMDVMDLVDGVFLAAFEGHPTRPPGVPYGQWLEGLIDPTVRDIAHHPDEELENIRMARSACEAGPVK